MRAATQRNLRISTLSAVRRAIASLVVTLCVASPAAAVAGGGGNAGDNQYLDPFSGTATTCLAAAQCGRHSIGVEIDPSYFASACKRLTTKTGGLFSSTTLEFHP